MSLAVLSDEDVRRLLESLTHEEAESLSLSLKTALHEYSTSTQTIEAGLLHQPQRTSVYSSITHATTLFMPSCNAAGHGVKVVTTSAPEAEPDVQITPTGSITLFSPMGTPQALVHAKTLTAFRTALASTCLLTKRATVRTLTVFGAGLQAYWHIRLALMLRGSTIRTINVINRRFSENAKYIIKKFYAIPAEVRKREGWENAQFSVLTPSYGDFPRLQMDSLRSADVIYCCTPSTEPLFDASILTNHEGRRKGRLIVAIGSYTREMQELPTELLIQATRTHDSKHRHYHKHATEGGVIVVDTLDGALKEAGEIIEAGLQPRQLVELGELAMIHKAAMAEEEESRSSTDVSSDFESLGLTPGSSVSAMSSIYGSESGKSGNGSKRSGSMSPIRRSSSGFFSSHNHRRSSSQVSLDRAAKQNNHEDHLARWLTSGNVIYKSVGLGLMDLVVGLEVVKLAKEKGVGNLIENFS